MMRAPPILLELFSGTGSIGRAFERLNWHVCSVDIDRKANPTICCDIKDLTVDKILEHCKEPPVLIWASPPCTQYSIARTSAKTPRDLEGSDSLVAKALELAREFGIPFLMENPHSGLLKSRPVVEGIPMRVVDYCMYGANFRKRTAIWTNTDWVPARPLCVYTCPATEPGKKKHSQRAQRVRTGDSPGHTLDQLHSIPPALCDEIAEFFTASRRENFERAARAIRRPTVVTIEPPQSREEPQPA